MEDITRVHKLLRPDEMCIFAAQAKEVKLGNKRINVLVALISNCSKTREEIAVFIVGNRFDSQYIRDIIPVYADLTCKVVSENPAVVDLSVADGFEAHSLEFLAANPLKMFVQNVVKAQNTAKENNLISSSGLSHQWVKNYRALSEEVGIRPEEQESASSGTNSGAPASSSTKPADSSNLEWISKMLKTREPEFTTHQNINIFFGTWNVNDQKPVEPLDKWLLPTDPKVIPDIYCIGFQELDLTAEALLLGDTSRAAPWDMHIQSTLVRVGSYVLLMMKQLVGILLLVYVKSDLLPKITDVQSGFAAVGIMGMMGNKGGVSVRFNICDSTFCVVNSHLNAHNENIARRNQDYHDISRHILFANEDEAQTHTIFDHDFLFWIGDLNYRIDLPDNDIRQRILASDFGPLLEADQLLDQRKQNKAFDVFTEEPIRFAPTYKYDKNSTSYDSGEARRSPAWCDRVLWRAANPPSVTPVSYSRHELLSSDHRPVSAIFTIQVQVIIVEARQKVYQELLKQLDIMENECMPDVTIGTNNISFDNVYFLAPVVRTITIENTGQVLARWRFIPKLDEHRISKPWMVISPTSGIMLPGEQTTICVTMHVDNSTAPALNLGQERLEDILILHLEHGKDYFVTVSGNFMPSCFGSTLEHLVLFPNPVRASQPLPGTAPFPPLTNSSVSAQEHKLHIPKELWRVVDVLFRKSMDQKGIFTQSGTPDDLDRLRECLDTGAGFDDFSPHTMAEALLLFLESLRDPVVPFEFYSQCLDVCESYPSCKQIVSHFPVVHYNVFYYLMSFLRELLNYSEQNNLQPTQLAALFGRVLLRRATGKKLPDQVQDLEVKRKTMFVQQFLEVNEHPPAAPPSNTTTTSTSSSSSATPTTSLSSGTTTTQSNTTASSSSASASSTTVTPQQPPHTSSPPPTSSSAANKL
ncbi:inositol 5-phosphatase 4 [Pelomyxa schiedti]|nr:inositol 5-phosphatase 4 [Pelomyxa schiedti]